MTFKPPDTPPMKIADAPVLKGSFGDRLLLERAGNDGWTIVQHPDRPRLMGQTAGAYTNTEDMLKALTEALT